MKRFSCPIILFFLIYSLFSPLLLAEGISLSNQSFLASIQQAQQLSGRGKYLEAQQIYEKLMKQSSLTKNQLRRIRDQYEKINIKLLFSRFETPNSLT